MAGCSKYPLTHPGFFVIIHQKEHNLKYEGEDFQGRELNYGSDEQRILGLIDPHAEKSRVRKFLEYLKISKDKRPNNIAIGANLTKGEDKNSFNAFMRDEVLGYANDHRPSFVMLFLLTHGFENGRFLLSAKGTKTDKGKIRSERNCCGADYIGAPHLQNSDCHARHITYDIIKPVEKAYPSIPKVFVIQCCRGGDLSVVEKGKGDPHVRLPATTSGNSFELFIPDVTDTIVLRACVEGSVAWVMEKEDLPEDLPEGGSLLVQSFCDAAEEMMKSKEQYKELLEVLKQKNSTEGSEIAERLQQFRDDMVGGWIMNVCHRTSSMVTRYMPGLITSLLPDVLGQMLQQNLESSRWKYNHHMFIDGLQSWKRKYEEPDKIERLIELCSDGKKGSFRGQAMLTYLWYNVREVRPNIPLNMSKQKDAEVEPILNKIIKKMREEATKRFDKQQPHISSSLAKKLSFLEMLECQRQAR